jgi:hypothetical protein
MKLLDKSDLQCIVILKRTPEFPQFMEILNQSLKELALVTTTIKDDVVLRWNQGKSQELLDIIRKIKSADEELHAFKTEARQHIE